LVVIAARSVVETDLSIRTKITTNVCEYEVK